jgi:hypothetical protein
VANHSIADRLHEVIAALDRRVRYPDRAGEAAIARDASTLRGAAVARLDAIGRDEETQQFEARWRVWRTRGRDQEAAVARRWRFLVAAAVLGGPVAFLLYTALGPW